MQRQMEMIGRILTEERRMKKRRKRQPQLWGEPKWEKSLVGGSTVSAAVHLLSTAFTPYLNNNNNKITTTATLPPPTKYQWCLAQVKVEERGGGNDRKGGREKKE